jgi:hypothetical protein
MKRIILLSIIAPSIYASELSQIPAGYKIVKDTAICQDADPCSDIKKKLDEANRLNRHLTARVKLLEDEIDSMKREEPKVITKVVTKDKECKPEIKMVYVDKVREVPKTVTVTKTELREGIVIGGMAAYSQDGIETASDPNDPYAANAYTYNSVIGGAFVNGMITDRLQLGGFGMFGGINKTLGVSLGIRL